VNPVFWSAVSIIVVAIISSGATWITLNMQRRKIDAEARSIDAETAKTEAETARDLAKDVDDLRKRVVIAEDHATTFERDNAALKARIARLESATAMALVASRVDDYASLADFWDLLSDSLVFTAQNDGGKFLWVNQAFCRLLGRTREDILALGWRKLIHPRDIPDAAAAEATVWHEHIWGFVNRYIHADGSTLLLRWYCPAYKNGVTVSVVVAVQPRRKDD
jgi:PAS domain S-box-containing protein